MTCKLEIVSQHRDIVGDDAVREFRDEGGSIGRSLQNDWILPDPERYISGKHAVIDFKGGIYYLVDTSSNGVYVNGDCDPVGKGNVRRLFNGDVLRFGDFEINVSIDEGESLVMPLDEPESKVREHVATLVADESYATGVQLLDEDEMTGDDDFQSALFGGAANSEDIGEPEPEPQAPVNAPKHAVPKELAEADLVATDLIDSFLDGLGINRAELDPSTDLAEVMQNAGEILHEFVAGVTGLIASRANMKNAFKLDQTTVLPRHNNPLKLSANTKDSLKQLLIGKAGEYLGPRDAAREVCNDLLFHQDAMLDAMADAFDDFANRFEPQELSESFDTSLSSNPLLRWRNKSKYWPMYCDFYPILTEKGSGRYPQVFAEEFVAAYEKHLAEFKRVGAQGLHLKETVILDEAQRGRVPPEMLEPEPEEPVTEDILDPEPELDLDDSEAEELPEVLKTTDTFAAPAIELNEPAAIILQELEDFDEFADSVVDLSVPTDPVGNDDEDDFPAIEPDQAKG